MYKISEVGAIGILDTEPSIIKGAGKVVVNFEVCILLGILLSGQKVEMENHSRYFLAPFSLTAHEMLFLNCLWPYSIGLPIHSTNTQ